MRGPSNGKSDTKRYSILCSPLAEDATELERKRGGNGNSAWYSLVIVHDLLEVRTVGIGQHACDDVARVVAADAW